MKIPHDLVKGAESAKALEIRQGDCHFGLVVIILVHIWSLGMKPLSQPLKQRTKKQINDKTRCE